MAYPVSFNMDEFKGIRSFADRVKYCENRLKKLGAGTSRRVYQIDNEKCLKLAKNRKGIAQNIEEINLENDEIKIDGSMAVCWSQTLSFTVERSTKSLIGSAVSGEGLVNVYRGTGQVWLSPNLKIYDSFGI